MDIRSKELDNTAVPLPFEIFATLQTTKYEAVEKLIHRTIDRISDLRIRQNREFFNVSPEMALSLLKDIAATLDDAVIYEKGAEKEHRHIERQKAPFQFKMVGIKVGEELIFEPTGRKVIVIDEKNKVEDPEEGHNIWSLSGYVAMFMPEQKRNASGAYQGPKYFTYKGETLDNLRKRVEKENE